ncbi:MAG: sensor histidine kinase, partial [Candidatus Binatia bacterium]
CKDGTEIPLDITLSPLEANGLTVAITAIRNLSERRRVERERDRLLDELRGGRERLKVLSTRLLEAQESDRRAIARELHDEIGQALTAVSYDLQAVQRGTEPAARGRLIDEALTVTQQVLRQVRDMSLDLRPTLLDDLGLTAAVRWYLERQARRLGCRARLTSDLSDTRLAPPVETACFRIAQEALTNVARHAGASDVRVELRRIDGELHPVVRDDGGGFDVDAARTRAVQGRSVGLLGMEERAILVGGRLEIDSRPGTGTAVHAWFPLPGVDAV